MKKQYSEFREYTAFALKDGLITCVGVLSAVAISRTTTSATLSIGIILVTVLASSVAIRSALSDKAEGVGSTRSMINTLIILLGYLAAGLLLLVPYMLFSLNVATVLSVVFSILGLSLLPYLRVSQTDLKEHTFENVLTGVLTAMIGLMIGLLLK